MTRHEQLTAYLATLGALLIIVMGAMIVAALSPELIGEIEAFGLGTVTGGLIGVLRIPSQRNVTIDQPAEHPIPTKEEVQ